MTKEEKVFDIRFAFDGEEGVSGAVNSTSPGAAEGSPPPPSPTSTTTSADIYGAKKVRCRDSCGIDVWVKGVEEAEIVKGSFSVVADNVSGNIRG